MNLLERAVVEKAGHEHGWENVVESVDDRVVLASARHRGRATVVAGHGGDGWRLEFPAGRLVRELDRTLPGLVRDDGTFAAADLDTLTALLRRAAELSQSLPDEAARTFRDRTARELAAIAANGTEVERLVRQRVGQQVFRQALLDYWGGACAVTGLDVPDVLRASHAKPWAECATDDERLDVFNGFLVVAHLDALFDRGLVTFAGTGTLIVSDRLDATQRAKLHLDATLRLRWLAPEHEPYLQWHRKHVFK